MSKLEPNLRVTLININALNVSIKEIFRLAPSAKPNYVMNTKDM